MPEPYDHHDLDSQLRNVSLPPGLQARLQAISAWSETELDSSLAEVPISSSLATRLKQIPTDDTLETAMQYVALPVNLRQRLYALASTISPLRSSPSVPRWVNLLSQALSLSLLVVLGTGYGLFAWQLLARARNSMPPVATLAFSLPHEFAPPGESAKSSVFIPLGPQSVIPSHSPEEETLRNLAPDFPEPIGPKHALADASPILPTPFEPLSPPENEVQLARSMRELRKYVLGAPVLSERDVLDLESVHLPVPRGVLTPLVPGYDRGFLLRTRVHPPVFVAANPTLAHSVAPLSLETGGFDRALRLVSQGQRPSPEEVRVEDFLAALQSDLGEATSGTVVCTMAGGPSLFGPSGSRWLGLNVRAGNTRQRTSPSTHLVIAVELSPRLVRSGTWAWLRSGLLEFLSRCEAQDRVSILLVQRDILLRTEPLDRRAHVWLSQSLPEQAPFFEPDSGLALQAALETALRTETGTQVKRVVLVTEGRQNLTGEFNRRLRDLGAELAPARLGVTLAEVSDEQEIPPAARSLAESLRGDVRKITSRRKFVHFLQSQVHGDSAVTAAEVKIVVRFRKEAVQAYRLVGHEANALAQLIPPALEVDLHPGDEAHVLFELLPQPDVEAPNSPTANPRFLVAECEQSWNDPITGEQRVQTSRFHRNQSFGSWEEMPFWLRQAVVAGETAEWLRGSRLALRDLGWGGELAQPARLAELVRELSGYGESNHSLPQLGSLLRSLGTTRGK